MKLLSLAKVQSQVPYPENVYIVAFGSKVGNSYDLDSVQYTDKQIMQLLWAIKYLKEFNYKKEMEAMEYFFRDCKTLTEVANATGYCSDGGTRYCIFKGIKLIKTETYCNMFGYYGGEI
jgi:hypothetical protein